MPDCNATPSVSSFLTLNARDNALPVLGRNCYVVCGCSWVARHERPRSFDLISSPTERLPHGLCFGVAGNSFGRCCRSSISTSVHTPAASA